MSLRDKTILITRRADQAGEFVAEVRRRGGRPLLFPLLHITDPPSWEECDRAIRELGSFDAVAFSSANAARKFLDRCRATHTDLSAVARLRLYAVGEKTAAVLREYGLPDVAIPDTFSGKALAGAIPPSEIRGKRFLVPRGSRAGEDLAGGLRGRGADVVPVTVYETVMPASADPASVRAMLDDGIIDVITFASPSAAEGFTALVPEFRHDASPRRPKVAVIGPVTAEAVRSLGMRVDIVAATSTVMGLVDAIDDYFG